MATPSPGRIVLLPNPQQPGYPIVGIITRAYGYEDNPNAIRVHVFSDGPWANNIDAVLVDGPPEGDPYALPPQAYFPPRVG